MRIFKRAGAVALALCRLVGRIFLGVQANQYTITINVYNWGMNIADGTDDTLDVIAAFEEK